MILAELATPHLAAAERFYGGLFGGTFQDIRIGATQVAEAALDGEQVAILIGRDMAPGTRRQPVWLTFFAERDADAAAATATQIGARLVFGSGNVPNPGREAVLADPQGAVFAVLASSSGDPPDVLAKPGACIWSSLITTDPDIDAAFYQRLFGYDVFDLPGEADAQHLILASGGYARASANPLPSDRPGVHPFWLNFIRVNNANETVALVVWLGGRVAVPPHVDRHGGKVAVALDPMGAPFGLVEWPDDAHAGHGK